MLTKNYVWYRTYRYWYLEFVQMVICRKKNCFFVPVLNIFFVNNLTSILISYRAYRTVPNMGMAFLFKKNLMYFIIILASSCVAGLECTGPAGVVLHFLAKLFEFCQKILIFIQHISFRLTNQLKKWKQVWQVKGLQIASTTLMFDSLLNVLHD